MLYYNKNKSKKKHILRILVIVAIIVLSSVSPKTTTFTSKVVNFVVSPFAKLTSLINNGLTTSIDFLLGTKPNRDMVNQLTKENQDLKAQINKLELIVNESDHLKDAYDFSNRYKNVKANIVLTDNEGYFSKFSIDKGSNSGIEVGDIVVSSYRNSTDNVVGALVGKIEEVNLTSSVVSSIMDERYNISFLHLNTGITGIINDRDNNKLEGYLLEKVDVKEGDKIYTSGLGGIYPRGIYIGQISSVSESEDRLSRIVGLDSPVDYAKLYEVFVLKDDIDFEKDLERELAETSEEQVVEDEEANQNLEEEGEGQ